MDRLLSFAKKFRPPIQLVGDIAISAALVAALSAVAWAPLSGLDKPGSAILFIVPGVLGFFQFLLVAPLVIVPVYGVAKGRFGFVIGPILLVTIVYGLSALALKQKDDVFPQLTNFSAEPAQAHTLLAVDDDERDTLCDEVCIKVLTTSRHTLAKRVTFDYWRRENPGLPRGWFLYTPIEEDACFAKENARLALDFLLRGFPNKCAAKARIPDFDDGLLLRVKRGDVERLPEGFVGRIYEYVERIEGQDRLLARHIKGGIARPMGALLMFEKRPSAIDAGPAIDSMSFLASEIGTDVTQLRKVAASPFPYDAVLAGIERFFDHRETIGADSLKYAKWAWSTIALQALRNEPRMVKERILGLLKSHDPLRNTVGLDAMFFLPLDEQLGLPDDVMLDLIVVPLDDDSVSRLKQQLERHFGPERVPPSEEIRERAKAYLSTANLSPWKVDLLQRISGSLQDK